MEAAPEVEVDPELIRFLRLVRREGRGARRGWEEENGDEGLSGVDADFIPAVTHFAPMYNCLHDVSISGTKSRVE